MNSPSKLIAFWLVLVQCPFTLEASQSANYQLNQTVIGSIGDTRSGSSKLLRDSGGEPNVGQSFGKTYSIQAGFFNDYFLPPPTPTITSTPIRTFGGELMSADFVYAAPNPIRGSYGSIYFDLSGPAEVQLKIFTINGDLVISQHWFNLKAGTNNWVWNTANMANGVYLLWIKATSADGKSTTITKKIALIK